MALAGGGGASNVAGSNPAGVGSTLNYIGDHAYAYSGPVENVNQVITATTVCLDFWTGARYTVGTLCWLWNSDASTADTTILLELNGETIYEAQYAGGAQANNDQPLHLLIPSYSRFRALWGLEAATSTASFSWSGRVYE